MAIAFDEARYDLVYCALLFEYVEWPRLLPALAAAIRAGGGLGVLLQRPSAASPAVTPTRYTTLLRLEDAFHFVEPGDLAARALGAGLDLQSHYAEPLTSGKSFEVMCFRKGARSASTRSGVPQ